MNYMHTKWSTVWLFHRLDSLKIGRVWLSGGLKVQKAIKPYFENLTAVCVSIWNYWTIEQDKSLFDNTPPPLRYHRYGPIWCQNLLSRLFWKKILLSEHNFLGKRVCQPKQVLTERSLDGIVCRLNSLQTEKAWPLRPTFTHRCNIFKTK